MLEGVGSEYTHGHVQDDEEPEYGDLTYLAMVWCAGVAIGLIFYGVSEPLTHSVDASNKYNNNGMYMQHGNTVLVCIGADIFSGLLCINMSTVSACSSVIQLCCRCRKYWQCVLDLTPPVCA